MDEEIKGSEIDPKIVNEELEDSELELLNSIKKAQDEENAKEI